jgi:transposase
MFIEYNQSQTFLLPPNFKEFLWDWHEAVILNELVDELRFDKLIWEYSDEWRPAYHPKMLLKVMFYWYMHQTFSSRKLAKKLKSDIWFMYIAGNNQPDFRTINRFRKEKWYILEELFVQVVLKAKELWMITFWTVCLDGTKIYANAAKDNLYTVEKLEEKMSKLFEEAQKIDQIEDGLYWDWDEEDVPEELKTKEWRDKKRREIKKKKEALEQKKEIVEKAVEKKEEECIKQERINLTDNDARLMMMKRKDRWVWYNPQIITENQFILVTTVPNSSEDTGELKPIMQKFYEKYEVYPEEQRADAGYASEENYAYLEKSGIKSYIPHQKWVLNIDEYKYSEKENSYTDKEWNKYIFKQNIKKEKWWKKGRPKKDEELKEAEIEATQYIAKLWNWENRIITVNKNRQRLYKENDKRLYSKKWKEKYRKRSGCVENVFWNIKMNFWFERFLLRGFSGVQIEWNLISLAHNFQKMMKFRVV